MTSEAWKKHIEESEGIIRPSLGGLRILWEAAVSRHRQNGCQVCKDRARTRKATIAAKAREELMKDCGLAKGTDSMGRKIWE